MPRRNYFLMLMNAPCRIAPVAMLVCCSALSACDGASEPAAGPPGAAGARPPVLVETELAKRMPLTRQAESVGTLIGNESVTLTAKLTEQVSAVYFEGGELVQSGDVLVELVDVEQLALLREAEANLRETELQLQRLLTLGREIATAAEIDVAQARVDGNVALLEALRSRISDRKIRAPFDGVIGFRQISVGALLSPGTVIAELDDIDPLKLDFTLPEHYLSDVAGGDVVTAKSTAWAGEYFVGAVSQIGSRVDPVTRAFSVRALIDNAAGRLRPGMLMTVNVALAEVSAIVVSETALLQSGGQSAVYMIDEASVARRVPVRIGRRLPGAIEILDGVDSGDRVVTNGQLTLRPGSSVREAVRTTSDASMAGE
ncbi:MAG: efflux RND transporter periplasmic adaptor subunit [Congregibacter sp.]